MNGLDHSKAAERILDRLPDAGDGITALNDFNEFDLRVAEVHVQLATAGAIAALTRTLQRVFENDPAKAAEAMRRRAAEDAQLAALGVDIVNHDGELVRSL